MGSSGGHGLKTHVQREAEFQNAPFIDANKGRTVDMTGGRVFGLHQNGVPVAGGLQKGDEVFARSMLFPHAGCGGSNVRHLTHASTLDALTNGFVSLSSVANGDGDVRILNRFGADVDHVLIGDVDVFEFDLNHHFTALVVVVLFGLSRSLCCLGGGDFRKFSFPQRGAVKVVGDHGFG